MRLPIGLRTAALSALPLLPFSLIAQPPGEPCTGHWEGTITVPTASMPFDVDFSRKPDGTCAGDITVPSQNSRDVTLLNVMMRTDSVRFTAQGIPGAPTFVGARSSDGRTVRGMYSQGGSTATFSMTLGRSIADNARASLEGMDAWIDSALVAWKVVGLSVGITVDGRTVYLKGHGLRDREKALPVTPRTIFAIGSSSKAFTTFAMGTLVDQGKLKWDIPVRTYLPWFRMHDDAVTLRITPRDLVTHRSGLPRHDLLWYNNVASTREQLVRHVAYLPLNKDLREIFQYNNLMYLTAGYLVGTINGSSWEDGLRELVLVPLGMTRTNFSVQQSRADADHSEPYTVRNDSVHRMPFRDISLIGPAGSINSSAEDMLKWVGLHLAGGKLGDRQVIQSATLRDMYRPYTPISGMGDVQELGPQSYGLGWFIDTYRGRYRAQHGGNIDGFSAAVQLLPRERIGIVVLVNQNGAALAELIARHAMDRILGSPRKNWSGDALAQRATADRVGRQASANRSLAQVKGTTPSHATKDYAATYADSGYGNATVSVANDTLTLVYNGIAAKLRHFHYETFAGLRNPDDPTFEDFQVTFRTNSAGRIDAMLAAMDANVPPVVFARQADPRMRQVAFLQKFVGRYRNPLLNVTISLRDSTLLWTQNTGAPVVLEPLDGLRFRVATATSGIVEFVVDASGGVTAIRAIQPTSVTEFPRVPAEPIKQP